MNERKMKLISYAKQLGLDVHFMNNVSFFKVCVMPSILSPVPIFRTLSTCRVPLVPSVPQQNAALAPLGR